MCKRAIFFTALIWLTAPAALVLEESQPANVKLAWDPSPDTNVTSYALYGGTNSGNYLARVSTGTNLSARIGQLAAARWFFVATAVTADGIESLPSNEIQFEVPIAPTNARTVSVLFAPTLTNQFTNIGFFRIWLQP